MVAKGKNDENSMFLHDGEYCWWRITYAAVVIDLTWLAGYLILWNP